MNYTKFKESLLPYLLIISILISSFLLGYSHSYKMNNNEYILLLSEKAYLQGYKAAVENKGVKEGWEEISDEFTFD